MDSVSQTKPSEITQTETKFHVALNGMLPNTIPSEVKIKLATLFKATPEQINYLLENPSYIVKRDCTSDIAAKYKAAIERTGCSCILIEETPVITLDVELPNTQDNGNIKNLQNTLIATQNIADNKATAISLVNDKNIPNIIFQPTLKLIQYNKIRSKYEILASTSANDFSIKYDQYFHNIEDIHNEFLATALNHIGQIINEAISDLVNHHGINDIDDKEFIDDYLSNHSTILEDFSEIDDEYLKITLTSQQIDEYRTSRRENRGRWEGSGFGLSGAISGAMKAGALNITSGALHGAFNFGAKLISEMNEQANKNQLFEDENTKQQLVYSIYKLGIDVHWALIDAINSRHPNSITGWITDADTLKASKLFNNVSKGIIKDKAALRTLLEIVSINPYETEYYQYWVSNYGDVSGVLEDTAKYFGVDVISEYKQSLINEKLGAFTFKTLDDCTKHSESIKEFAQQIGCKDTNAGMEFINTRAEAIKFDLMNRKLNELTKNGTLQITSNNVDSKINPLLSFAESIGYGNAADFIDELRSIAAAPSNLHRVLDDLTKSYSSDHDQHFFVKGDIPIKKITNLTAKLNKQLKTRLLPDDFVVFFDETLFGSGDTGIGCTYDTLYSNVFDGHFAISLQEIKSVSCKGILNKEITITATNGNQWQ